MAMKIYTKTGDKGESSLFNGKRVLKNNEYMEAYGTVDELNAAIGLAISLLKHSDLRPLLESIQKTLFVVGADLATPFDDETSKAAKAIQRMTDAPTKDLEAMIDSFDAKLKPLKNFVLPGGTQASSALHLARTICRRAERLVVGLCKQGKANSEILMYLNRLSDALFVVSRYLNQCEGYSETPWKGF